MEIPYRVPCIWAGKSSTQDTSYWGLATDALLGTLILFLPISFEGRRTACATTAKGSQEGLLEENPRRGPKGVEKFRIEPWTFPSGQSAITAVGAGSRGAAFVFGNSFKDWIKQNE